LRRAYPAAASREKGAAVRAFVLIHGGHQGSWFWERVVPLLDRPALAVDLPGRGAHPDDLDSVGIASSVASVVADIAAAGLDRVVIVGNSIASATMPGVAAQLGDRVERLVFLGTPIALEGQTIMECFPDEVKQLASQRLRTSGGATTTSDEDRRAMNCNDMDEEQAQFALERAVPDSQRFFSEPISWVGVDRAVPRTYVRLMLDQALRPHVQDHMIANLRQTGDDVEVVDLDAGHCPMVSNPSGVAALLNAR
jgi:pimeloyl-ACP methyl ester carboxylesterase